MKKIILAVVISLVIASPVHASPLTWEFSGVLQVRVVTDPTNPLFNLNNQFFQLRIFLDTDRKGTCIPNCGSQMIGVSFTSAPEPLAQAEVDIAFGAMVIQLDPFAAFYVVSPPGGDVVGVAPTQPGVTSGNFITFSSSITQTPLQLGPIAIHFPLPPNEFLRFVYPPAHEEITGRVTTFRAAAPSELLPEAGSIAQYLTSGLIATWLLWHRRRKSSR